MVHISTSTVHGRRWVMIVSVGAVACRYIVDAIVPAGLTEDDRVVTYHMVRR